MAWTDRIKKIFIYDDSPSIEGRALPNVLKAEHLTRGFLNSNLLSEFTNVSSERGVLAIAAAYRCIAVRAEAIAMLSGDIVVSTNGITRKKNELPLYNLLYRRPNPMMNAFTFHRTLIYNKLITGEAFAIITRDVSDNPIRLDIKKVLEKIYVESERFFYCRTTDKIYEERDVIYLANIGPDGSTKSAIQMHSETFGKMKASSTLSNNLYTNKMFLGSAVLYPESVKFNGPNSPLKAAAEQFQKNYGGIDQAGKVLALDQGAQIHQFENIMSMKDAEYIMDMNMSIEDVCRIFGVPPYKIFHFNKMTYDNMEQMAVEFVQSAVLPDVRELEQELDYKAFTPYQLSQRHAVKYEIKSLMRGDIKSQAEYFKSMVGIGKYTINEVREMDDQNPVEGGDVPFIQANNYFPLNKMAELADATIESKKGNGQQLSLFGEDKSDTAQAQNGTNVTKSTNQK